MKDPTRPNTPLKIIVPQYITLISTKREIKVTTTYANIFEKVVTVPLIVR